MTKSLAVAGKGGTGKSTVAALFVSRLGSRNAGPVLAVDADPDSSLGTLLGIEFQQTIGDLREEVRRDLANFPAGMTKASYVEAGLHQIIEEADGFDLVTMGKGEGSGCYCYLNSLIKKFSDDLAPSYPWLVIDNEAGLEHISRRTSVDIDGMVILVTDNPLSISSAEKIKEITDALPGRIRNRFLVTNMIREERVPIVQKRLDPLGLETLCHLPYDPKLEELIFNGEPVGKLSESPVWEGIDLILDRIGGKNGNS
jgi:CO dehydrogenase maturation factor